MPQTWTRIALVFCFLAFEASANVEQQSKICSMKGDIQRAVAGKSLVFVSEIHSRAPKPISETVVMEQLCTFRRPVVILTEFIWPSWQKNLDHFMGDSRESDISLIKKFIEQNVAPSAFSASDFSQRMPELLLWAKQMQFPIYGIDQDNFDGNFPDEGNKIIPQDLRNKVSDKFKIKDDMIDDVTGRDLNMAAQILRLYSKFPKNTLFIVYLGSNHSEKIPTLLQTYLPLDEMLVIHLGRTEISVEEGNQYKTIKLNGKMSEIQHSWQQTEYAPDTLYMYPYEDLDEKVRSAQAVQMLIHTSGVWVGRL